MKEFGVDEYGIPKWPSSYPKVRATAFNLSGVPDYQLRALRNIGEKALQIIRDAET